jgi:UDP-GlcNAc3NAcA epimerase
MILLEAEAKLIMTDSGGVQKEAWFMEKPVVVLREETEWVEIIQSGNGKLAGASKDKIIYAATEYLNDPPRDFPPIFGNGQAAEEILHTLVSVKWS